MNDEIRNVNNLVIGKIGSASKSIIFKENEFKKELAPKNAKIEQHEMDGENYITMTYKV